MCDEEFYIPRSRIGYTRYCSKECHNKGKIGKEISKSDIKRYSKEYKIWRKKVLNNSNNKCDVCGNEEDLIAHHKINVRERPDLIYDVNNGVCWCRSCHSKYHNEKIT